MNTNKKIVIIGATSAIAEHCARLWIHDHPAHLVLVGRDLGRLERVASDLLVRSPQSQIEPIQANFNEPAAIATTAQTIALQGRIDIVLIAHGMLPEQLDCQGNLNACYQALEINGVSPALFAEAFALQMAQANHGTLAIIGSVAGDRGRKSNYVYGAAKGLITRYTQGLQHRFAGSGVKVVLIKPGPTDTPMTASFKAKGVKMASPVYVAKTIVQGINQGKTEIYAPPLWKWIMLVIIHLPKFIFNKMDI
jgi:hypothetical protein